MARPREVLLRGAARELLLGSTTAGSFEVPKASQFNFSRGGASYHYELPKRIADALPPQAGFADRLIDALDAHALRRGTDEALLGPLRGKSMLILGDSGDYNLWSRMCHCPRTDRKKGREYGADVVGTMVNDSRLIECHGKKDFETCEWRQLDFQIHFMDGAYGIHPWGRVPYHYPGFLPDCTHLDLEACLEAKWMRSANRRFGFRCFRERGLKQPELFVLNVNIWYWLRISWYGRKDPPAIRWLS